MTTRLARLPICGLVLVALLGGSTAHAQFPPLPRGVFGAVITNGHSPYSYTSLNPRPRHLAFVEVTDQTTIDRTRGLKATAFGPFRAPAPYERVAIYQFRATAPGGQDVDPVPIVDWRSGTIALIASTRDRAGRVRWWSLQDTTVRPPDQFEIASDPTVVVELAVAVDAAVPLVRSRWEFNQTGGNSSATTDVQMLLDFSTATPTVLGQFEGIAGEGGARFPGNHPARQPGGSARGPKAHARGRAATSADSPQTV